MLILQKARVEHSSDVMQKIWNIPHFHRKVALKDFLEARG
jgi:hypothetical protein